MSSNPSSTLKSALGELTKTYITYDSANRPQVIYEVQTDAADQAPCLVTTFTYVDSTSSRVLLRKETVGNWNGAWG